MKARERILIRCAEYRLALRSISKALAARNLSREKVYELLKNADVINRRLRIIERTRQS